MNALISETAVEPLLFSWESPRRRQLALPRFWRSLWSHTLSASMFFKSFIHQWSHCCHLQPASALITSGSEEGRTLLRWIDAEDPSLAFTTHRPPEARLRACRRLSMYRLIMQWNQLLRRFRLGSRFAHPGFSAAGGRTIRHARRALLLVGRSQHLFRFQTSSMLLGLRHCRR